MTSCNGQANNGYKQNVIKQTIQFPNFNNQISDVVRTIFQDSKGNIWFGVKMVHLNYWRFINSY
jgi:hypothetical protein